MYPIIKRNYSTIILNFLFVIYCIAIVFKFLPQIILYYDYKSWQISEYLVNYQGGFVRRGLIGELLYFFKCHFDFNIQLVIKIICLVSLLLVNYFFVSSFLKRKYPMFILPLSFFLGVYMFDCWMKRDNLLICLFILILWILKSNWKLSVKVLFANLVIIIALFVHEAFALFSIPIVCLLFIPFTKSRYSLISFLKSVGYFSPSLIVFIILSKFHGNFITAQFIWNSWASLLGLPNEIVTTNSHGFISSIGWETKSTFIYHFEMNFLSYNFGIYSMFFWPLAIIAVYYILTNYFSTFNDGKFKFSDRQNLIFSVVLIFQLTCLLPFFLILSCDLGRIFFYWVSTSMAVFIVFPEDILEKSFPVSFLKITFFVNSWMRSLVKPSKSFLSLIMILIGIPNIFFSFEDVIRHSVLGNIFEMFSKLFNYILLFL